MTTPSHQQQEHQLSIVEDGVGTSVATCSCGQASDDASSLTADLLPRASTPEAWWESHLTEVARSTGW